MLAILDYQAGNQTSVARALQHLDIPCKITAKADDFNEADGVIFPGVGSAVQAMRHLETSKLKDILASIIARNQPLLGICLGCQILLEYSEEGPTRTLGVCKGVCRRFEQGLLEEDGRPIQVPHMGWNTLVERQKSPLLENISDDAEFYFVHGYYPEPAPELALAHTRYGKKFCSFYGKAGLWAAQFHPEKSGKPGLQFLSNFYNWCLSHPWH